MKKLLFIPVALVLITYTGCKDENTSAARTDGKDTTYSGPLFRDHIRTTAARTPEEERRGFKLPPGFEVTLYASEPDIGKPINISFDARGRLWVTQSFEYPFAATPGKGKDRVTILEDTDGDGKADKFTHFEDTLNIPIGVIPVNDGAVTYSIPNIYKYTDANGDGKADAQKKLLGPFEYKDTHGMINNFIIGYDGWIHSCHGYTNRDVIAGADGDTIRMFSGNTFRFRRDGSRVEHMTDGRINPFGLAYDELGYLYSVDCHTSPLYQLIRGGDYTQWGKEDLMGFAPDMKHLENEATALAGLAYYADKKFPSAYRDNFYMGDVVTCRVYRDSYVFKGSSPVGKREEDFVLSADPWFRPVDVKLGPDGALYIADFYNSIIGHYEVALNHPKRDKIRGRIWRITYKGDVRETKNWLTASLEDLLEGLKSDNLPVRFTVSDQLVERIGKPAIAPVQALINKKDVTQNEYIHSLWILERLGGLTDDIIKKSATHADPYIRVHTMRVLAEQNDTSQAIYPLVTAALNDQNPHVQRAAVELLAKYSNIHTVETLVAVRQKAPDFDSHLIYTIRLALRNLLRNDALMKEVAAKHWRTEDAAVIATVLPGVQSAESGKFLYEYVKGLAAPDKNVPKAWMHIAQFIPAAELDEAISTGRKQGTGKADIEFSNFRQLQDGIARRGAKENAQMQQWGRQLAVALIKPGAGLDAADTSKANVAKIADRRRFAMELAGNYKLTALQPALQQALKDTTMNVDTRISALHSLLKINPQGNVGMAKTVFEDKTSNDIFRRRILQVLGEFPGSVNNKVLSQINNVPPDMQQLVVLALASSPEGINIIFNKVRKGDLFARMLIQPKVEERILQNISKQQEPVFKELTANLQNIDKERQSMIAGRITDFTYAKPAPSAAVGRTVFIRNCAICHSISDEGGTIGPQLDGVGKWGVTALCEKILDPNRNVSESFRNYTIKLKDGKTLAGLYRRDEGALMVFADMTGKEFSVPKKDIAEKTASKFTLMPDQFSNTISPEDFNSLIAYLITVKN